MFVDRLADLYEGLSVSGMRPYIGGNTGDFHEKLDNLDRHVGIRTRHGCAKAYHAGMVPFPQSEYVGARLARLEAHVRRQKQPHYFHLGAEAEYAT